MNRLACIIAIAGWYLVYPPSIDHNDADPRVSFSEWKIDGQYGSEADCDAAYYSDLSAMGGLNHNSRDFLLTQAGRCIALDDLCLAK